MARLGLLWAVFAVLSLLVLGPALEGEFVSDDLGYIVTNPYIQSLSLENLRAILDPTGEPALYTINWAPVHLLSHALEWWLWGADTTGYHVVNVLLHALATTLLVALFLQRGFPLAASLLAGLVFLVHPANVEAVAWIFQLKTIGCLALATGALLALQRRPLVATALFAAALLCKASALFALPVALVFAWITPDAERRAGLWRWLCLWTLLALLYAWPQFFAFQRTGWAPQGLHPDAGVHARTIVAIGARYLLMAATGHGTAAFHEPARALSWWDPWWLAGLVLGTLLGARLVTSLIRRRQEAAWWMWAAAAWAPISQVFAFKYPMADRYLYTILPGLLGAGLLAGRDLWQRIGPQLSARLAGLPAALSPARLGAGAVLAVCVLFALASHERAGVWRSSNTITIDTVVHYPDGIAATVLRASRAARMGDAAGATVATRRALELGFDRFMIFYQAPEFGLVMEDPGFRAVLHEMAARWIEASRAMQSPTQADLRVRAHAHLVRGERREAIALFETALERGGGFDEPIRAELAQVRASLAREPDPAGLPEAGP